MNEVMEIFNTSSPENVSTSVKLLLLLTVLSLAPSILILMTCFTRIIIVLSFVRTALATQQMPPNQVLVGLSLFLTFFIMAPIFQQVNEQALTPLFNEEITLEEAYDKASVPFKEFMSVHTRQKDLALFLEYSNAETPESIEDIPLTTLVPAFAISEIKTAFQIGFMIFIPFLVIDMVVASVLMSMGMMMLPPVMISLPFKILLFVLVDGWYLVVKSLLQSF
ncbi:flagellar type III secretion system pore protein FliP [Bacillus infantis]|jgi:flagellar biosynthesis protein FliP|uniref:flagellar type III secretion system pore protein FliP n=1 Tax=Bacillaceae TaxID=186817 RepID=UPI000B9BA5FC|nr:flagellar type III secretion system pore protein FliP [Bacillus infantis]MCK6206213.1 flagellar type III secretion system pore protein FliP [Bacillus infantis]MCR6610485.1 flagellar type III secretion system pore protein FliP [Bacillus infantis]MDW2876930.1 flagellar type III secretion system pore protein FliP [Bacillus infantis]OXT18644.1 flagellar biosynthetic protein FliP [Bacillus sp. OG2]